MLQESMTPDSTPTGSDIMSAASTELLQFKQKNTISPTNFEESEYQTVYEH